MKGAFGGEGEHEAGEAAEDHAEADEGSDDPDAAGREGTPDHDGQDEGDDGVEEEPAGAVAGLHLEEEDDFDDAFEEEIKGEDEGEGDESVERMEDEVDAGEEVDGADEQLPDEAAGGVGCEGEDEVGDGADDHEPAEDERDADAGDGWDEDGEDADEDEDDAEGDGPAGGFGGKSRDGRGFGSHWSAPKVVDFGVLVVVREDTTEGVIPR